MIDYEDFRAEWVAVKTDDPDSILDPIDLTNFSPVTWEEGMKGSVRQRWNKLFVSPAIHGWVLLFGDINAVFERYHTLLQIASDYHWHEVIAQLSTRFPEVQLFTSYDGNWRYLRASEGKIQRAFGFADGVHEIGLPSPEEIRFGGTAIPGFFEQREEFLDSELPYKMAGLWSINPLEFDEPSWEWLREAQGLLYQEESNTQKNHREWLENWKKGLMQAYMEDKYGIDIKNLDSSN
ncbi:MAG TPA: hypothetical protein VK168_12790 [Saprospiraceae bacterium]|nr:hypothetical protein [Saprospiraceae bacterium]